MGEENKRELDFSKTSLKTAFNYLIGNSHISGNLTMKRLCNYVFTTIGLIESLKRQCPKLKNNINKYKELPTSSYFISELQDLLNVFLHIYIYTCLFICLGTYLSFTICLKRYAKNQAEVVNQTICNCWPAYTKPFFLREKLEISDRNCGVDLELMICIFMLWMIDLYSYLSLCLFICLFASRWSCCCKLKQMLKL